MLYHGGETPPAEPTNLDDFYGDLLVKNSPQYSIDLPNKTLSLFGVRRSFAAPATPDGKIVYGVSTANSFQEDSAFYLSSVITSITCAYLVSNRNL
jgi:hypothetical protein